MRTNQKSSVSASDASDHPYFTWSQLKRRYPDQWVLLLNPVTAKSGYKVEGGELVASSPDQMGMLADARKLPKGSRISVIYTGSVALPASTALCL